MNNAAVSATTTTTITTIQTHAGVFHCDDVYATAILLLLFPGAEVIRKDIREANPVAGTIFVDVGGAYDPEKGLFDHHQRDFDKIYDDGQPYASAGLVWEKFGSELAGPGAWREVAQWLKENVDAPDVGGALTGIATSVSSFNPCWDEKIPFDDGFDEAVIIAKLILKSLIKRAEGSVRADKAVQKAFAEAEKEGSPYVTFEQFMPWSSHEVPESIKFVVYPSARGGWSAFCVPSRPGGRDQRLPFPEAWAGKPKAELSELSGIKGLNFCHNGRFIVATDTKEQAVEAIIATVQAAAKESDT